MDCLLNTKRKLLFLSIITFMIYSCGSINNYKYQHTEVKEIPTEAVNIAIADYSKTLQKRKDSSNITAVKLYISYTSTDWFYIAIKQWGAILDEDGKYRIDADKFDIEELNKYMGQIPPSWIPTDYAEKDNVLYVWHDPQAVLTNNIKNILDKYDLIYHPGDPIILTTDGGDISYIFCKSNYKKKYYRKVKASLNTPLPSCGCK